MVRIHGSLQNSTRRIQMDSCTWSQVCDPVLPSQFSYNKEQSVFSFSRLSHYSLPAFMHEYSKLCMIMWTCKTYIAKRWTCCIFPKMKTQNYWTLHWMVLKSLVPNKLATIDILFCHQLEKRRDAKQTSFFFILLLCFCLFVFVTFYWHGYWIETTLTSLWILPNI